MPIECNLAHRRILRLCFGVSLCFAFAQGIGWQAAFLAPILTTILLTQPIPAPGLKAGMLLILAILLPLVLGSLVLLPLFEHQHTAGILILTALLLQLFYWSARGAPELPITLLIVGITLNVTIGSVSVDAYLALMSGLLTNIVCALACVWLAFALLPDPPEIRSRAPQDAPATPEPYRDIKADTRVARLYALRALVVVLPVAIFLLLSPASSSYTVVMVKVATLGRQASSAHTRNLGRSAIISTVWGGIGSVIGWYALKIWPALFFFGLLIALATLICGRRVFRGQGMHPQAEVWSYALLTMLILLLPAAQDAANGSATTAAFWTRLIMIGFVAVYSSLAVTVFDAFAARSRSMQRPTAA